MSVIKSTLYLVTIRLDIAEVWVIELEDSNKNDPKIKYTGTKKRMEYPWAVRQRQEAWYMCDRNSTVEGGTRSLKK